MCSFISKSLPIFLVISLTANDVVASENIGFCRKIIIILGFRFGRAKDQKLNELKLKDPRDRITILSNSSTPLLLSGFHLGAVLDLAPRVKEHGEIFEAWHDLQRFFPLLNSPVVSVDFSLRIIERLKSLNEKAEALESVALRSAAVSKNSAVTRYVETEVSIFKQLKSEADELISIAQHKIEISGAPGLSNRGKLERVKYQQAYADIIGDFYKSLIQKLGHLPSEVDLPVPGFNHDTRFSPEREEHLAALGQLTIAYASTLPPNDLLLEAENYLRLIQRSAPTSERETEFLIFIARYFCQAVQTRIQIAERLGLHMINYPREERGVYSTSMQHKMESWDTRAQKILKSLDDLDQYEWPVKLKGFIP